MQNSEVLEVHLEELGQRSWRVALLNTVTGSYGSAQFRFVARPIGSDHGDADTRIVGATFPMMRFQDLNNRTQPNAWLSTAQERLEELDVQLLQNGWRRQEGIGSHWWSRTYVKAS